MRYVFICQTSRANVKVTKFAANHLVRLEFTAIIAGHKFFHTHCQLLKRVASGVSRHRSDLGLQFFVLSTLFVSLIYLLLNQLVAVTTPQANIKATFVQSAAHDRPPFFRTEIAIVTLFIQS